MKFHKILKRITAVLINMAILAQAFGVVPVFAEETVSFFFNYNYDLSKVGYEDHDILLTPDIVEESFGGLPFPVDGEVTVGDTIKEWPEEYRVLGYTFKGWNTDIDGYGYRVDTDTEMTQEMYDELGDWFFLWGQWEEHATPSIPEESFGFETINALGEPVYDGIVLKKGGVPDKDAKFETGTTVYDAVAYDEVDKFTVRFRQEEPNTYVKIELNNVDITEEASIKENKDTVYFFGDDAFNLESEERAVSRDYEIKDLDLPRSNDEDQVLKITIGWDEDKGGAKVEYIFNIRHYKTRFELNYGNTPYGGFMKTYGDGDTNKAAREAAMNKFDSDRLYNAGMKFSEEAWNPYGEEGKETKRGTRINWDDPENKQYIDYDKDDTAIVVYAGMKFTDPGIKMLYGPDGSPVTISAGHPVKRRIYYDKTTSLKYEDWNNFADPKVVVHESDINGSPSDNIVDWLEKYEAKPGVYTMEYEYEQETGYFATAKRNVIVLPYAGDVNMDNYYNALDALVYDNIDEMDPTVSHTTDLSTRIYWYRGLDVDGNGVVSKATDGNYVTERAGITPFYPSISIARPTEPTEYKVETEEDGSKAKLYMEFLGTGDAPTTPTPEPTPTLEPTEEPTATPEVEEPSEIDPSPEVPDTPEVETTAGLGNVVRLFGLNGEEESTGQTARSSLADESISAEDTFWIGYRFKDVAKIVGDKAQDYNNGIDLRLVTLTINYDDRYVKPAGKTLDALVEKMADSNKELFDRFEINKDTSVVAGKYEKDRSTVKKVWDSENETNTKTLKLEMRIKSDGSYKLDDGYFIKIPFVVESLPPDVDESGMAHRLVMSTQLGANTFNAEWRDSNSTNDYYGSMWDTSGETTDYSTVTGNLMDVIQYMGDYVPKFGDRPEPQTYTFTYGDNGILLTGLPVYETYDEKDGKVPTGLKYNDDVGTLTGTCEEANDFHFFIGKQEYYITVVKKKMNVIIHDRTKTYGDIITDWSDPKYYTYNPDDIADRDKKKDSSEWVKTPPSFTCADTQYTEYGASPHINMVPDSGVSDFYEFVPRSEKKNKDGEYDDFGTLTVDTQRVIDITKITGIQGCSFDEKSDKNNQPTFTRENQTAKWGEFEYGKDQILPNDQGKVQIKYNVTYDTTESGTKPVFLKVTGVAEGVEAEVSRGKNYKIGEDEPYGEAEIESDYIANFTITKNPKNEYTYGDLLDLSAGEVSIINASNLEEIADVKTFAEIAKEPGFTVEYDERGTYTTAVVDKTTRVNVNEHHDRLIKITYKNGNTTITRTVRLTVHPKTITITADNKTRIYGDENSTATNAEGVAEKKGTHYPDATQSYFTYTIDESTMAWGEKFVNTTTKDHKLIPPTLTCTADKMSEIGDDYVIEIKGGEADNYKFVLEPAKLEITQRPITVQSIDTGIPWLYPISYLGKEAPFELSGYAFAGVPANETEDADKIQHTMTVNIGNNETAKKGSGLVNGDKIKLTYTAAYDNNDLPNDPNNNRTGVEVDLSDYAIDTQEKDYSRGRNYKLDGTPAKERSGVSVPAVVESIELAENDALLKYTFGERLDLSAEDTIKVTINIEHQSATMSFKDAMEIYGISACFNGDPTQPVTDGMRVNVADSNKRITFTPAKTTEFPNPIPITTRNSLSVEPHELHVIPSNVTGIYGDMPGTYNYQYVYNEDDFQYKEKDCEDHPEYSDYTGGVRNADVIQTPPSIGAKENNGITDVSERTPAGVYTIRPFGGYAPNYKFVYETAQQTIRQRPLVIEKVEIENLTSKELRDGELQKTIDKEVTKASEDLKFTDANGLLWDDDVIHITGTATYRADSKTGEVGAAIVDMSNMALDPNFGSAGNYYLLNVITPQRGTIADEFMDKVTMTADPTKEGGALDGDAIAYTYGDPLDLSGGEFILHYDSGRSITVTFKQLIKDYGFTAKYTGEPSVGDSISGSVVEDVDFLTLDYNGRTITITPPDGTKIKEEESTIVTGALSVGPRTLTVTAGNASYTYGDEPPTNEELKSEYEVTGFAPGESESDLENYTPPTISIDISKEEDETAIAPDNRTGAGTYEGAVKAADAEADNYEFEYKYGTLTVDKRKLTIKSVDNDIIPILTSYLAREHGYVVPIKLDDGYEADNYDKKTLVTGPLAHDDDEIKITFTVVYNTLEQSTDVPVVIEDIELSGDCSGWANYVLDKEYLQNNPIIARGEVRTRLIQSITVMNNPSKMNYIYGEWFAVDGLEVEIGYDSGSEDSIRIGFADLESYGIKAEFVKKNEGSSYESIGELTNNAILTVTEHDGAILRFTVIDPKNEVGGVVGYSDDEDKITVAPRPMRIVARDASMTYGDANAPDFEAYFEEADLVNGDTLESAGLTEHNIAVTSKNTENQTITVGSTTRAGEYILVPSADDCGNYTFDPVNGTLTIGKKSISITSITSGIPVLDAKLIYKSGSAQSIAIGGTALYNSKPDADSKEQQMTVEGVINGDFIGITYSAVYESFVGFPDVNITEVAFDAGHEDNNNYIISSTPRSAKGVVDDSTSIVGIEIAADPVLRDDNNQPIEYTYGDKIDLNRGAVTIKYDSELVLKNVKFNELDDLGIDCTYVDNDGKAYGSAEHDTVLTVADHNGKHIKITVRDNPALTDQTAALVVNKAHMTVTAKDMSRDYGDENPEFEVEYNKDEFVNSDDENSTNFTLGFDEPKLWCDAGIKSPIGDYTIEISGEDSANYEIDYIEGTLTVDPRQLDVVAITSGIPPLTAKIILEDPLPVHTLDGVAENVANQLKLNNLSPGDKIKITYKAIYTSTAPKTNVVVNIDHVDIDKSYEDGGNYILGSVPATASGGNIYEELVSRVEVTKQPKLVYTYGEDIDLSQKGVRITYDSGRVVSDIAFSDLDDYNVKLDIVDVDGNETPVGSLERLTVPEHNGAHWKLTPSLSVPNLQPSVTAAITVNKKPVNVNISSISSVYGEKHSDEFRYSYGDDFVYDETPDTIDNFTEPNFVCTERDGYTAVSEMTNVGNYTINMAGGESDNYDFVYNRGVLSITKRPIVINNILSGIPHLTSQIIAANRGSEYRIDGTASDSQMNVDGIVNGDSLSINYTAVYDHEIPQGECNVDIENMSIDDTYGRGYNYTIKTDESVKTVIGGGFINAREIVDLEIINQPKLDYTYGDRLDLSGIKVKVSYDSGAVEEVSLNEITRLGVDFSYTDGAGSSVKAFDNDVLSVPKHDGKYIMLTAQSPYNAVAISKDKLDIKKLELEFGDSIVDSIVYDGETVTTTGLVIFKNPQNGDVIETTATFTFENADAGEDKNVSITDIKLVAPYSENYTLPATSVEAKGTIEKAPTESPVISADDVTVSAQTNTVTITPPAMTETQINGGAKYEYSIDGGVTWQESNVFENPGFGVDCIVLVRFKETDNFEESETQTSTPVEVRTFNGRLVLISTDDEEPLVLKSFYTNVSGVETEKDLRELIGETESKYYQCYVDAEKKIKLTFPLIISGETIIYTTLKSNNKNGAAHSSGGSSGGGGEPIKPKPTDTPIPTTTPSPTVTSEPSQTPEATPLPVVKLYNEPYISGYDDKIRPDDNMKRAEAAAILINITGGLTDEVYENPFPDVASNMWYAKYIPQAVEQGFVAGFEDGLFKPDQDITREQFTTMIVKLLRLDSSMGETFTDVNPGRWSYGYICAASTAGLVTGYDDGTFKPEKSITRSEAVKIVNAAIGRLPDKDAIDKIINPYKDLPKTHWAYYELIAASCEY